MEKNVYRINFDIRPFIFKKFYILKIILSNIIKSFIQRWFHTVQKRSATKCLNNKVLSYKIFEDVSAH